MFESKETKLVSVFYTCWVLKIKITLRGKLVGVETTHTIVFLSIILILKNFTYTNLIRSQVQREKQDV